MNLRDVLAPDDTRDALRKLGGLVFGIGALMLVFRKEEDWGTFAELIAYLIPAVLLFGGSLYTRSELGELRPWQSVLSVLGLVFVVLTLLTFVNLVGDEDSAGNALNLAWIFALTAALAAYAAIVHGIRYQLLLAGIAAIVAWIAFWDEVIGFGDDLGILRGMFGLAAIGLLVGGIRLWRDDRDAGLLRFGELFTAAGIAAVIACGVSITSIVEQVPLGFELPVFEASWFWDTLLLLVSLGLIGAGTIMGVRGPVYIGAIGLTLFLIIAGLDLDDDSPDPSKVAGWPLILLIGGGLAVLASFRPDITLGDRPRRWVDRLRGRPGGIVDRAADTVDRITPG